MRAVGARVGLNLNFEFESAHELLLNLNLTFKKINEFEFSFFKVNEFEFEFKNQKQNEWIQPVPSLRGVGGAGAVPP